MTFFKSLELDQGDTSQDFAERILHPKKEYQILDDYTRIETINNAKLWAERAVLILVVLLLVWLFFVTRRLVRKYNQTH